MAEKYFSKDEAIKFGWQKTFDNIGLFIKAMIIIFIFSVTLNLFAKQTQDTNPALSLFLNVVYYFGSIIFGIGLIRIYLKLCDNQEPQFQDLYLGQGLKLWLSYLVTSLLYILIVLGGLILILVPGIIWAIRFQYCQYLVIDKGLGPVEALRKSSAITMGQKRELFVFGLLLFLINILGFLAFFFGLFITMPLTMIAAASVYRKLLSQT
jgi:hypothetical protein